MLCVIPIENMTELNKNHTTEMVEKAGQRKMDIVFNKFDQYNNIYRSEIVHLNYKIYTYLKTIIRPAKFTEAVFLILSN